MTTSRRSLNFTFTAGIYTATLYQLGVAFVMLWLTRLGFILYNPETMAGAGGWRLAALCLSGTRFDLSAFAYFNALFILLRIFPARFTTSPAMLRAGDIVYWISNSLLLLVSLADIPFFRFAGSRMRMDSIRAFLTDPNLGGIINSYAGAYWWAFVAALCVVALLVWLSLRVRIRTGRPDTRPVWLMVSVFIIAGALTYIAMRGRTGSGKPLSIADAVVAVDSAPQVNIVLNTPFCLIRSIKGGNTVEPVDDLTAGQMNALRNSLHIPAGKTLTGRNVVLITLESGSQHWLDSVPFYVDPDSSRDAGLMPFLDSIASRSLTVVHCLATGVRSVEGIAAIYAGLPTYDPLYFMLSPYNNHTLDTPARLLAARGYSNRAYFGSNHGSFTIDQMLLASGFSSVADRDAFGDDSQYDGTWGIYDHAMARYVAGDLSTLTPPFIAAWFTLSAHEPFNIPAWGAPYRSAPGTPQIGAEYADKALREFFTQAEKQPWFYDTIFIITGDHGCREFRGTVRDTPWIKNHVPLIIYTPDGSISPRRVDDRVVAQPDIAPTLLSLLGYPDPYVALGTDILDDSRPHFGLALLNGSYLVADTAMLVALDPATRSVTAVYDHRTDPALTTPLTEFDHARADTLRLHALAFLRDYTHRLLADSLYYAPSSHRPLPQ